jgi:signal transduction histidine kinase
MSPAGIVARLAALPDLAGIPEAELRWLAHHGQFVVHEAGTVIAPKGQPIEWLWVILSGYIAARVDRGAGPQLVMGWRPGEVTGMLPFSRMTGPPGDVYSEDITEAVMVHADLFPEMIHRCPMFTAHTVHLMLDRARRFNTSDLQDEKMISLGKLSAGLAHELNNPASAIVRCAKLLAASLSGAEAASKALGAAGLTDETLGVIDRVRRQSLAATEQAPSPMQLADREEALTGWLERRGLDDAYAATLADMGVTTAALDTLVADIPEVVLDPALRWLTSSFGTLSLARDIERAGTRVHELVGAVKRFTYMDDRAGVDLVDVEGGLRDTLRVLASKVKAKGASVTLDCEPDLPRVRANGGELNQVWMNLLDNAMDAISESGAVEVTGRRERDRIVVRVIDDGAGIPADLLSRIFDPFFTTKPPGQGTGLGLDITRWLVRRHRGEVTVRSQPGRTEFRVSLLAPDEEA